MEAGPLVGRLVGRDEHGRLVLRPVRLEGGDLGVEVAGQHGLGVVRLVGLPHQQRAGPVVRHAVLGEEVRVARRHQGVAHQEARGAVVGVEAVALPRVVAEQHVGAQHPDPPGQRGSGAPVVLELAVDRAQEHHLAGGAQRGRRGPGLVLAGGHQRRRVGRRVPGALRAIGADHERHLAARLGPLGQGGAGPELDVVGVGAHRQGAGRHREVEAGHQAGRPRVRSAPPGRWRSSGTSTSQPRAASVRTSTARPRRRASAWWRANEPGP